jgi:predicted  nucleic acid-binding Zn-ribbon protein
MLTEDSGLFSDKQQVLKSSPTKELSKSINNTDEERLETLNGTFADELAVLKGELDTVRKSSAQTQNEYKNVQNELNDLKKTHDDQMKKMQKKLHDLITEIDEEKKTRLALQVELERLKKTILSN